jgi:hypothetical protein
VGDQKAQRDQHDSQTDQESANQPSIRAAPTAIRFGADVARESCDDELDSSSAWRGGDPERSEGEDPRPSSIAPIR